MDQVMAFEGSGLNGEVLSRSKNLVFEGPVQSFTFERVGPRPGPVHINIKPAKDWTKPLKTSLQRLVSVFSRL